MRSPGYITVAVRKPDGKIALKSKPYESVLHKYPFLKKPVFRGVVILLESMIQGVDALSFSANFVPEEEGGKAGTPGAQEPLSFWGMAISIGTAFVLGIGLFVALPHVLAAVVASPRFLGLGINHPLFHLIDGLLKIAILLTYVYLIGQMKDIYRVFQYHGAEHKSIFAFEAGEELTVENAKKHTTLHPRCGTSFLLFLVLISVAVFSILFPILRVSQFSEQAWKNHVLMVFIKIALMMPVAGLSYEFIKACAFRMESPIFKTLIWPGLMLQKLTTREPDDSQLEVALASLRSVLQLEKNKTAIKETQESEIAILADIPAIAARVEEFAE